MPKVAIGISVGTEKFEMPHWMVTFQWACAKATPNGIVSLEVCCTLQRHTLAICDSELIQLEAQLRQHPQKEDATHAEIIALRIKIEKAKQRIFDESRIHGDQWIERNIIPNLVEMRKLTHSFGVRLEEDWHRWNLWLDHGRFPELRALIDVFYAEKTDFRIAMDSSIEGAKQRFSENHIDYPKPETAGIPQAILDEIINAHCYEYLAEEVAGVMGLWQEAAYNMIIYPDKVIPVLDEGRKLLVPAEEKALLHWNKVGRKVPKPPTEQFLDSFLLLARRNGVVAPTDDIPIGIREPLDECLRGFLSVWQASEANGDLEIPAFFLGHFA
ncbi:MAG: hypothetical protein U9O95_02550, partial [Candidatus Marinimicrobia bacterium]|nr:hypothetical protein [Candidatus Neomarinimicrobiota bacterium]